MQLEWLMWLLHGIHSVACIITFCNLGSLLWENALCAWHKRICHALGPSTITCQKAFPFTWLLMVTITIIIANYELQIHITIIIIQIATYKDKSQSFAIIITIMTIILDTYKSPGCLGLFSICTLLHVGTIWERITS